MKSRNNQIYGKTQNPLSISLPLRPLTDINEKSIDTLIFILHGDNNGNENNNFEALKATFEEIISTSYPHIEGRVEYHLVSCENLSRSTLSDLSL